MTEPEQTGATSLYDALLQQLAADYEAGKVREPDFTTRVFQLLELYGARVDDAVAAERQRCAQIVRSYAKPPAWIDKGAAEGIARAILEGGP